MTWRAFPGLSGKLRAAGALMLLAMAPACSGGPPEPPIARHLVIVTIDTLRADHVGAYGGPVATPALDDVARRGVWLADAYTPTPTTAPAHASLFTGLHPWRHGLLANGVPLDAEVPTLAGWLAAEGFDTAAFVSSYVLHERFGWSRSFEHYEFLATMGAQWRGRPYRQFYARGSSVTHRVLALLAERDRDERLFLWVHYFDPHLPYEPPASFAVDPNDEIPLDGKSLPPGVESLDDLDALIRAYRGEVRYADAELGRLVEGLREAGMLGETALVVTSDHGEGLGDHGRLDHGWDLFDEQVRVPLLLQAPGVHPRGRLEGMAQLEDLAPTALALLGLPAPPGLDGLDLSPWLRGEVTSSPRTSAVGRIQQEEGLRSLFYRRNPSQKWIGELGEPGDTYDVATDPEERRARTGAATPDELADAVARATNRPPGTRELDDEARSALEALGYLEPETNAP